MYAKIVIFFSVIFFSLETVFASSIMITSPNGGEYWNGSQTITWSSTSTSGFVNVFRCTDLTCTSTTSIALNLPDTGSTTFNTTGLNLTSAIYIEDSANTSIFDISDALFTIDNSISSCNSRIISNNSSTTLAKLGDIVTVSFDTCEAVSLASVVILGRTVTSTSAGGNWWSSATTTQISDQEGIVSFTISYSDLAGNSRTRTSTANGSFVRLDRTAPSVSITLSTSTFAVGGLATTTFQFNEIVNGFDNSDITVSGGTISTATSSDGGVTWTSIFTPNATTTSATNVISVSISDITDIVGNPLSLASSSSNYTIDTVSPSVSSISFTDNNLTFGETSVITVVFSETVSSFSNDDITGLNNGTLSSATSTDGGITWTLVFTPTSGISSASNNVVIGTDWSDGYGNVPQSGATSSNYVISTLAIVTSGGGGGGGGGFTVSVQTPTQTLVFNQPTSTPALPLVELATINKERIVGQVLGVKSFNFSQNLKMKSTGSQVMELQKYLSREGFFKETPTKYFGVKTKKALIDWQKKNNLPSTGYFGPMSRALINK